jgi:hypothetical protein
VLALLAQKAAVKNWGQVMGPLGLTGWTTDVPVCEWSGITCSESGAVTAL